MRILVSACLLGENCKYNGSNNYHPILAQLLEGHEVIPVCPEMLGGLPSPRIPCERKENSIIGQDGKDYTMYFVRGAQKALTIAKENEVDLVIVKKKSPSCGLSEIYDGTFQHRLIRGSGVFAELCSREGFVILEA